MGRELKRVPLKFKWPKDKVWKGYIKGYNHEPPRGRGYQIWETVSEGSPISPVFKTPEELADWLVSSPDYKWRDNDAGTTREQWLRFINGPGWAPSMVFDGTKLMTGVQAVTYPLSQSTPAKV